MTFDLTAEQQDWSRRAREFSEAVVARLAPGIDEHGVIPAEVRDALSARSLTNPFADGAIAGSVVIEEIAAVSAGVATAMGMEWTDASPRAPHAGGDSFPGLRGSVLESGLSTGAAADRARLVLCAVAVGVGRASIAHAVRIMKDRGVRPGGDETTPHWTLADAAAELDAARLLTLAAAQVVDRHEPAEAALAMAARVSATAAERAVEAASLIVGATGYRRGSLLERLSRDARTLTLVIGTPARTGDTIPRLLPE